MFFVSKLVATALPDLPHREPSSPISPTLLPSLSFLSWQIGVDWYENGSSLRARPYAWQQVCVFLMESTDIKVKDRNSVPVIRTEIPI
jgi:hypothetical protein